MDMENYILKMMIYYKEHLFKEDVKEKVDLLNQMEVIMKVILKIMLLMVMEVMLEEKDLGIKANGRIMYLMVQVRQYIQMDHDILGNF
jgi:hypothetical protein